ncbi:MAG TPA: AraC family transcriptional regulator [Mesorhizobium sp.]|jgi:AraC-like DNA-binding protein|uniref:AraC family transcriptional regulator n=1 Tax=Mesorhizobium sp. TaxID=1871066 RepID=UPI002DDD55E3|nr:AraC family transcriptional regulator [Mesorhizobium sp.]HEV2507752.1 AraC family transcriptional regulator [Mesorhizobium sp.]
MSDASEREEARLTRHAGLGDLELLTARYRDHAYALHTHDSYVFGVVVAGVEKLRINRQSYLAPANSVIIVNPEDPHDGEKGCDAGWAYRTCYPRPELMREVAEDLGLGHLPMFSQGILDAPDLAGDFVQAHRLAVSGRTMEAETAMLMALRGLTLRFADRNGRDPLPNESEATRRFRLYREQIEADLARAFDLAGLAEAAGVTRFQVIRDFKRAAGMTPGQYLRDCRIRAASVLMRTGKPLAEIAFETGFADQSHFNRLFKSMRGLSPGAFREAG